jgi:SAM-dependent methyltransferase
MPSVANYFYKPRSKKIARSLQNDHNASYGGIEELEITEASLKKYNEDIVMKFAKFLNLEQAPKVLVDFGSGTGSLSDIWKNKFKVSPLCVEVDPDLTETLKNKGYQTFREIEKIPFTIDAVFSSNVLEHIQDDGKILRDIRKSLKSGGKIAIYVPAFQVLYSQLDRNVGHFRRYGRQELTSKLELAGFRVEKCFYSDSLGFVASLLVKALHFHKNGVLCSSSSLKIYDRIFYPMSRALDFMGLRHLFGKNLVAFAVADSNL